MIKGDIHKININIAQQINKTTPEMSAMRENMNRNQNKTNQHCVLYEKILKEGVKEIKVIITQEKMDNNE